MRYYTLVAGLPEFDWGAQVADGIYGEIRRELSAEDRRAAALVWELMDIYGLRRERIEQIYSLCASSPCGWVREWALFDRNLRNVIAAHTAREKGKNVSESLLSIEGDEIAVQLGRSSAADFNLRGELDYIDNLLTALEDVNAVEKERAIDMIRWDRADSMVGGDTFSLPFILSYLVKLAIVGRWSALDAESGRAMYDKLVAGISAR